MSFVQHNNHHTCGTLPPHASTSPINQFSSPISNLPAMKLTRTPDKWVEADQYFQTSIVPAVLREVNVDAMNDVLCCGIYSFFTSRHDTIPSHQYRHHPPTAQYKHKVKEVNIEKNAVKKRLKQSRQSGTSPEEVRLLTQEFHQLVLKHTNLARKVRKAEAVCKVAEKRVS